ncbi:glycosyltransferase [Thioflexithrix psekupsensis]|uniref:Glycosyltransferase 2-like domain-containing protein n=1 Tax=Thioflexithrix psekupsensis TaxID=1570016 RepID=A0A251X7N4_9GAMM|nr:glycosyltransferase [Thioflexithrix psekupsensis]OUD13950.1 hypothetical protein TPSD3_06295 [Thioflexithrix psekupsensis]
MSSFSPKIHPQVQLPHYKLDHAGVEYQPQSIDIIVCIHNALPDVQRCLASIREQSSLPYQLILVDDGSGDATRVYLDELLSAQPDILLLRNATARGYTCAANQGLAVSHGDVVILLNSDTIVTPFWLERLLACAQSDARIGLVGPLSNTASWQSIPKIEERGDWASNPLPLDLTPAQMANRLGATALHLYPRLPFLNGFCLLIKRAVLLSVGYFDEEHFARGYGEENDYCLRARQAGWELAVADDVYIYHAQSRSYSHEARKQLAEAAGQTLVAKHGQEIIDQGVAFCRESRVLDSLRYRAQQLLTRWDFIAQAQYQWAGKRMVFILPVMEAGGGANVVITEIRALRRMGVDAQILNFEHHRVGFERSYPELDVPVIYSPTDFGIPDLCMNFDAVIATANNSVSWIAPLAKRANAPILGYYIQDFEPYFHVDKAARHRWFWQSAWLRRRWASYYFRRHPDFRAAWLSYLQIPDLVCFTKTEWTRQEVLRQVKRNCHVIGASFDLDLFCPRRERSTDSPLVITAMVRPSSVRRAASRTMQVLRAIQHRYADHVRIVIFGVTDEDLKAVGLPQDFAYENLGMCSSARIAALFGEADIFVDFSTFQAMGLTAMEAMACGMAVIVPQFGGTDSFARHEENALVIDTTSYQNCYDALVQLIESPQRRVSIMTQAHQQIVQHSPERSAYGMLRRLFEKS